MEMSQDTLDLRRKGLEMLSSLEDRKLLERVVELIHQTYMEEVVEYNHNGQPVTRAELFESFRRGIDDIANGKGIPGEEMSKRLRNRFGNF
jgi:hypothetical protein